MKKILFAKRSFTLLTVLMLVFMTNVAVAQTYKITKIVTQDYKSIVDGELIIKNGTIITDYGDGGQEFDFKIHKKKRRYIIFVDPTTPKGSSPKEFIIFYKRPKDKQKRLEIYRTPSSKPYLTVYLEKE